MSYRHLWNKEATHSPQIANWKNTGSFVIKIQLYNKQWYIKGKREILLNNATL